MNKVRDDKTLLNNYESFKKAPFLSKVKPVIAFYNTLSLQPLYQGFYSSQENAGVTLRDFKKRIQTRVLAIFIPITFVLFWIDVASIRLLLVNG